MSEPLRIGSLLASKGLTGWALVERQMELQIEHRCCTEEHWRRHLESSGLLPSWERYNRWKTEHPDDPVPPEINAVRSIREEASTPDEPVSERKDLA